MKKPATLIPLLIAASISLYSQSFDMSISGGYGLPLATDFRVVNLAQYQNANSQSFHSGFEQLSPGSYGNGGNIAVAMDWFSKANIGCGLKFNALFSSPIPYTINVSYANGITANFNYTNTGFSYQLIPHINLKHDFKAVSPFVEMGMLIGITHFNEYYNAVANTGDLETSNVTFNGGIMLGFYSSLGVMFNVSKIAKITLSVNCSAASYSPAKWMRTSYTYNGVDQLSSLPISQTQGTFVKQLDLTVQQSSNQPDQELKFSIPFSNVGFNAGVCFVIPVKAKDHVKQDKKIKDFHGF